jgi:hypothetical protein
MSALTNFFDVTLAGESKTYNDHNWYTPSGLKGYIQGNFGTPYTLLKKPLSEYTIGEVKKFQSRSRDSSGQLWATGRYQIIPQTLKGLQTSLNLSDSTIYDKETQDKMGLKLLTERKPIRDYIYGNVPDTKENLEKAALQVAMIWSSVGVPYATQGKYKYLEKNQSYYSGGGDRASEPTEKVQEQLKELRENKDNLTSESNKGFLKSNSTRKSSINTVVMVAIITIAGYILLTETTQGKKILDKFR